MRTNTVERIEPIALIVFENGIGTGTARKSMEMVH